MTHPTVYRSFSRGATLGLLCAGELHKEGVTSDTEGTKYPFYCQVLVLSGRGWYEDDRGFKGKVGPGSVIQRFPDRTHSVRIDPKSRWHELFLGFGLLSLDQTDCGEDRESVDFWKADLLHPQSNRTMATLKDLFVVPENRPLLILSGGYDPAGPIRELRDRLESTPSARLHRLTGEFLGTAARIGLATDEEAPAAADPVSRARHLLESNLDNRIPLKELLGSLPLSYAHLRDRFKAETGVSPGRYRINLRMEKACYLILAEKNSPGEAARKLGYEDTSSFSKQFKEAMGLSPGEYGKKRAFFH